MNPFRRTCRTVASWLLAITLPFACTLASAQAEPVVISSTPAVIPLAGLRGSASPARAVSVTGSNLSAAILATAPVGFEVSSDNTTFGATATLQPVAGIVSGTFQVRIASSSTVPLGDLTGNLTLSSNLATPVTVGLAGFVEAGLPAYGTVQTFAGTGTAGSTDGNSTTARFNGPWGISADPHGNLYPIDYSGKRIRKVTPGAVASFLDSFSSFPPQYSAVDPATGHLYVSVETHRILRYVNQNVANYPAEAPVYGPNTDFADSVIVYAGASTSGSSNGTGTAARFNNPRGLAVHDGYLYVADRGNNAIRKINLSNAAVTTVSITTGNIFAPEGVCVDAAGVIYLTSTARDGVEKITTDGVRHSVAGAEVGGFVDGDADTAKFNDPHGITLDVRGNLIVADAGNHAIRRVTPAGDVVTVAGGSATGSYLDGLGTAARFNSPRGIVFGPDGWLYVTDFNNHRIRRVNATKPQVVLTPDTLALFTTDFGSASASRSVEVVGSASAGLITVTAPDGFEVSTDGTTYSSSVQVNSTASLRVRIAATTPTGAVSGDLSIVSENAGTQTLALSGVVNIVFTMSREQVSSLQSTSGNPSSSETVTLDGAGFTGPLNITAPQGFEISTDGTNFSPSVRLGDYPSSIQTVYRGEFGRSTNASGNVWYSGSGTEFPAWNAFAAITSDRSVVTWGGDAYGGDSSSVADKLSSDVAKVFSTAWAFAAVKGDGSVVTWGNGFYGGDSSSVADELASGVTGVSSTSGAFAALKSDGSVVTWGAGDYGGDSSSVAGLDSGVVAVFSNYSAFAALKSNGSVITWGDVSYGGDSSAVAGLSSGVTGVFSTNRAFAALKSDGSVVAWGAGDYGGNSSSVAGLGSGVTAIFANETAFAALKSNGSVVTWGASFYGGDSSSVAGRLGSGVTGVSSTNGAFAALKSDGSVVTWGDSVDGGNSSSVAGLASGVTAVYSNYAAFAALKSNGSVITWGNSSRGGDSSSVTGLTSGVTGIYSTRRAFAALKADGSVVTWGDSDYGGNSASVAGSLASEVTAISSTQEAFAALKADGSVVTWGNGSLGGSGGPGNIGTPVGSPPTFPAILHVRLASDLPTGPLSGEITLSSDGLTSRTIQVSGTVSPALTASANTLSGFQADSGSSSTAQTITLNGAGFSGPLTLRAPAGYELSTNGTDYASTARLGQSASSIQSIYDGPLGDDTTASGATWQTGSGREWSSLWAFAAITSQGAAVSWGDQTYGGNSSSVASRLAQDVSTVVSNTSAFAALKTDGSVVTWGASANGGNSSAVADDLASGVTALYSSRQAFAALKADGSVITWGHASYGGDSSPVASQLSSGVVTVYSNQNAFAALKNNGSVVTWGGSSAGGDSSLVAGNLSSNVTLVVPSHQAFAALKRDGSVVTWGSGTMGGNSSSVTAKLASNVVAIYSTAQAFAALKSDGSVVTWGDSLYGGYSDSVAGSLRSNVTEICANQGAFAALKQDGSVVTWPNAWWGGSSSSVSTSLLSGVRRIYSTPSAFAALKTDGSVVTWGNASSGGDSSSVTTALNSGVTAVYATGGAFAALKTDGSVVTWGSSEGGGDSSSVVASLASGVVEISGNYDAFAALKNDGTVVTWGKSGSGGSGGPANIGTPVNIPPTFPVTLHVRIAANAPQGPVSGDLTFGSGSATIRTLALSGLVRRSPIIVRAPKVVYTGSSSVRLEGTVNPNGFDTTVNFEYGTTTSYGTTVPVTLTSANGTTAEAVGLSLTDLAAGIYHYRITATNAEGTGSSSDGVFSFFIPSDGTPDTTYQSAHGSKLIGSVEGSAVDDNGRWFGVGAIASYGTTAAKGLVCINPDGTPDAEFHTNLGSGLSHTSYLSLQNVLIRHNGKILISGNFSRLNGVAIVNSIASINPDGTPDTEFNLKLNALAAPFATPFGCGALAEQADGKILGDYSNKLRRLNADGVLDTSFTSPSFTRTIDFIAVQPDGKILVGGYEGLMRLNADGSADTAFNTALGTNFNRSSRSVSVSVIRVAPDGGIWVGGEFTTFNSQSVPGLVRLNSDATLDSSALAAMEPAFAGNSDLRIKDIHLQRDGKIVVCGWIPKFNNTFTSAGLFSAGIRRFNADGSPDTPFSTRLGSGINGTPQSLAVRPTGELIVGGSIYSVNGQRSNSIAQFGWGGRLSPEIQTLSATYGSAIQQTAAFTTSGLSGTVSYAISPALPSGLSLNSATGVVSGTPRAVLSAATTYTITATGSTAGTAAATLTLSVAKAPLTVTANDATRSRGKSNPSFGVTFTGLVNGDTLSAISGAASYSCEATTDSSAGNYAITPSLGTLAAANYSFQSFVAGSLTVGKAAQTLNIAPLATSVPLKDLSNVSLAATSSAGLPVTLTLEAGSAATLAGSIGAYSLSDIGQTGTVTVRASQAGDADHEAAQDVLVSFDVTKSNQTITFEAPADKTFGDAPFNLSATADSGLAVAFSVISGPAQLDGPAITLTGAGTVVVRASQAGNGLYNEASVTRSFTVDRAAQTITFGTLAAVTYGDAPVTLAATSDSGLSVTYDIVSGPAALVGGTVDHDAAGTVVIRASQAGDDNHLAADPVERTLIVNRKALTVTGATAADKVVDESTAARIFGAELAGAVDGDEVFLFNADEGTFPQATAGNNLVVATAMTLDGEDAGNYTLVQPSLTASITELDALEAPSSLVATAGDGQVSVAFTAGAEGGSAITNYEFSTNNGTDWTAFSPAVTTSPAVITGLTNGTTYSIRLRAVNGDGSGTASDAVSATPVDPPIVFRAAAKAAATTSISVSKMTSKAGGVLGTTVSVSSVAATSEQGATVALAASSIQYTPASGFSGVDRFRVTFTSSTGTIVGLIEMTTSGAGSSLGVNPARLTPLSGGRMGIQFNGIPGVAYQLQRSTDLASWTTIATITAGPRGAIDFTDDNPPAPSGFYRLATP